VVAAAITPLDWTGGPALAWVTFAAVLYWLGGRGTSPRPGHWWRTAAFIGGLLAILAAVDSPLDDLADRAFWAHMTQHLLLITVAPPLLALARPWNRMWHGIPLKLRRPVAHELAQGRAWAPLRAAVRLVVRPLPSLLLFNVTFLAWHLPVLYGAALTSEPIHALEHLTFFAAALLFWTRVIDSPPWRSPLSEPGKLAYLASTLLAGWILAIVLAMATSPLYPAYADEASRPLHLSALTDQQLAAGIMWVPGSIAYTIAIVLVAYRMLEPRSARGDGGPAKALPTGVG
jgi:cytochrome c oxidase assembly factor CtaG